MLAVGIRNQYIHKSIYGYIGLFIFIEKNTISKSALALSTSPLFPMGPEVARVVSNPYSSRDPSSTKSDLQIVTPDVTRTVAGQHCIVNQHTRTVNIDIGSDDAQLKSQPEPVSVQKCAVCAPNCSCSSNIDAELSTTHKIFYTHGETIEHRNPPSYDGLVHSLHSQVRAIPKTCCSPLYMYCNSVLVTFVDNLRHLLIFTHGVYPHTIGFYTRDTEF